MEYYSALKRNEILIHAITRNNRFKIEKRVRQGCILSPCLFNFYAEHIIRNANLDESQARIKIARIDINNLRYAMTPCL